MARKEIKMYKITKEKSPFNNCVYRDRNNIPEKYQENVKIFQAAELSKAQLKNIENTIASVTVICFPGGKDRE